MSDGRCGFEDDAGAYWDDELSPDGRRRFAAHLGGCARCRRELSRVSRVDAWLEAGDPAREPVVPRRSIRPRALAAIGISLAVAAAVLVWFVASRSKEPAAPSVDFIVVAPTPSPLSIPAPRPNPPVLEIVPAADDWIAFREKVAAALDAFAATSTGRDEDLGRLRSVVGLSPRALVEALASVSNDRFGRAAWATVRLAGADGVRAVALEGSRRGRVEDAVRALAAVRDRAGIEAAVSALSRFMEEGRAHAECLVTLASMNDPAALTALLEWVRLDSSATLSPESVLALEKSQGLGSLGALAALGEAGIAVDPSREALERRSSDLASWLRRTSHDERGAFFAAEVLASSGDAEAVSRLLAVAASERAVERERGMAALVRSGDGSIERLREKLRTGSPATRRAATSVLGRIATEAAVDALASAARREPDLEVVSALGATRRPSAVVPLRALLGKPTLREAVVSALEEIPGREALEALLAAAALAPTRAKAIDALVRRGDPDAVPGLLALLGRGESEKLLIDALVKIGDPRAIPLLESLRACPAIAGRATDAVRALRAGRT